jgi:hydroxyacylglutathione hydrolase
MFVKRVYEPLIAQASYLIGCAASGDALVIDPMRDIDAYIAAAAHEGLRITQVTETHIHADFVSGARELANRTGATLCLSGEGGPDWQYDYVDADTASDAALRLLKHGDRITIGNISVDVLHTPGHTPEHLTFLITDGAAADRPIAAVTGDFVFVGDVGRPDLLERAVNRTGTMAAAARTLWNSLQAFKAHEDYLQIWPGHGAGSACGKGISAIPSSTLGYERRFNWAFTAGSEAEFIERVLAGQPEPPRYFATMKRVNKAGPAILGGFTVPPRLADEGLLEVVQRDAFVIDTRPAADFAARHLPGTLNIPMNSSFVTWAGWLAPYDADLYLIADAATSTRLPEVVRALALIGLDRVAGCFSTQAIDVAEAHGVRPGTVTQASPLEVAAKVEAADATIIDVRGANEWSAGHLPGAHHIPLGHLERRIGELPAGRTIIVQCERGGRSSIAASLLKKLGRADVVNMTGGYSAWQAAGLATTNEDRVEAASRQS